MKLEMRVRPVQVGLALALAVGACVVGAWTQGGVSADSKAAPKGVNLATTVAPATDSSPAARGQRNLLTRAYAAPWIDEASFDKLWTVWEPEWKSRVKPGDKAQIRRLTLERYGFTPSVDPTSTVPLQWVKTEAGMVVSCMSCHGGRLPGSGQPIPVRPQLPVRGA